MGSVNVSIARYVWGVAALAVILAVLAFAAVSLRRRFYPEQDGALARLTESVIGTALLVAVLQVLGAVGLFALAPILVACLLVGFGTSAAVIRRRRDARRRPSPRIAWPAVAVAGVVTAAVAAEWAMPTLGAYDYGIRTFDSLWYHMPWAASFAQSGRVTGLHFDLEFLLAFYPATSELFHGLGIVMLGRDTLSPAINLVWLGLALLAAWCIGRPRNRGAASVAGAAIVLAAPMMYFSQPGSADGDVLGVFLLLAAVALLLNRPPKDRAGLVLAAIAAGLALETKLTFLAPIAALTVGVLAIAPRGERRSYAGLWLGPLIVAGGFWYARDLIAIGNPLPWSSFGGLLPVPHEPLQQHTTYAVAHYLTHHSFWAHFFVNGMATQLGRWWWAITAVAVLGALLCLLPGAGRTLRMAALVALAGLAAYLVTPNSAMGPDGDPVGFAFNLRFAGPPMALAFALTPLAPPLDGRNRQVALVAGLGVILAATIAEPALWPERHTAAAIAFGLMAALACLTLALLRHAGGRAWRTAALAVAGAGLIAVAVGGYPLAAPLPQGALCVSTERLASLRGVGVLSQGPPRAGRGGRDLRRVLLLSADRGRRQQSRHLHRPSRPSRVVHADHDLPCLSHRRQCDRTEIPGHHPRARLLAAHAAAGGSRGALDADRSRRAAAVHPSRRRPAGVGVRASRSPEPGRLPVTLASVAAAQRVENVQSSQERCCYEASSHGDRGRNPDRRLRSQRRLRRRNPGQLFGDRVGPQRVSDAGGTGLQHPHHLRPQRALRTDAAGPRDR